MKNPYWHPEIKPHVIDLNDVYMLCFDIFNLVIASTNLANSGSMEEDLDDEIGTGLISPNYPELVALHHKLAEPELSKRLLRLAILIRTFDDLMTVSDCATAYTEHKKMIDTNTPYGHVFDGPELNLRQCCNKIIHTEDFRPVYHNGDLPRDQGIWGMTGEIELEGHAQGGQWQLSVDVISFLEAVIDLVKFVQKE